MATERIILGIDPGTTIMGYGLIRCEGKKMEVITLGIIKLSSFADQPLKLKRIFERTLSLIDEFHPDEMALEAPFFGKNVQSMLKLGRAQGVAMAAGLYRSVPIFEYSPKKIKQSITGNGNASKEQVAAMLCRLMPLAETPEALDATDGLAAAVCHFFQNPQKADANEMKETKKKSLKPTGSWKAFVDNNPGRIK